MPKPLRLRHPADFARLRYEGQVYHHRLMLMSVAPNDCPNNRYGFIVSRHIGKAVVRNRVKRQLREAVRDLHPHLSRHHDIVCVAKKPLVEQPFEVVLRTVYELAGRAKLVKTGQL